MISFKGTRFPKDVILYAAFFYVRYGFSYRDLEAIMEERGVKVDHSTLNRWVIQYPSSLALAAKKLKRAVDKFGDTIDFMLSEHRDEEAATAFFKQAINANGFPNKVVMDKSGANYAGLENINILLMLAGLISFVEILQVKYLNNLIEQDHRFIKKIANPMMGFKAFHSAKATIDGIETTHMIRKGQLSEENMPAYKQFITLVG